MIESLRKNKKGIYLMLVSSLCVCTGQLLWKLSAEYGFWALFGGFVLYGFGAIIMLIAYRFGSLSVLQPILSINYILALVLAVLVLGEIITITKLIGVFIVTLSVVLIGGGDN
jgi:drug/metabolite transporter (DMT)-like permease